MMPFQMDKFFKFYCFKGLSGILDREVYNDSNKYFYYGQIVTELSFYIFVNVVLLNLIFGIIIDTFAILRDQN
jgi:hypothetical protein